MSEQKYEFGDPIWVKCNSIELEGVYGEATTQGNEHWCIRKLEHGKAAVVGTWVSGDRIRLRTVAPARTGWRLPEPGDVIGPTSAAKGLTPAAEMRVCRFEPDESLPIKAEWWTGSTRYEQCFGFDQVRLVRLHDAPPEPPAPAAKPGPHPALDAVTAVRTLIDLVKRDGCDHVYLDAAVKILDRAATTLAGGAA